MIRRTHIRRISKKKTRELAEYTRLRAVFMQQKPTCEVCHKRDSTECHHVHGRGKNYLAVETWMAVCSPCHKSIHNRPGQARKNGLLK